MQLIKDISRIRQVVGTRKAKGDKIGLVPTMGYLHDGHVSLIKKAVAECDFVVVSIFVNPMQFLPKEDYKQYPRDIKHDLSLCEKAGAKVVFYPLANHMYTPGFETYVNVKTLANDLCGKTRPGHFNGVATIVIKLLNIVAPDAVYFGQKDAQQAIIIKRVITDLNINTELRVLPIVREQSGLALSSRNVYLNKGQKQNAASIYKILCKAKKTVKAGITDVSEIQQMVSSQINKIPGASVDYVKVLGADNLEPLKQIKTKALLAVAVYFTKTRLIDNVIINT